MVRGRQIIGGVITAWALGAGLAAAQTPAAPAPASPPTSVTAEAASQGIQITEGGTIQGVVVAGKAGDVNAVPLPGVSVTATNTLTGRKYTAASDVDGKYALKIPKNGRYVVRAELMGFALSTTEVVLNGDLQAEAAKQTGFGLELASRAEAAEAKAGPTGATAALGNGVQNLSLSGLDASTEGASAGNGNTGATLPSLAAMNDTATGASASSGSDSITVAGGAGQMNGLANFSEDEIHQRISDAIEKARAEGRIPAGADTGGMVDATVSAMGGMMMMGGPSGGPGGGFGGRGGSSRGGSSHGGSSRGSGAFRSFNPSQPHGSAYYVGDYSALDSNSWSATRQIPPKQQYTKNSYGVSFIGSPYIPGLQQPSSKHFIALNFNAQHNTVPNILNASVPTTFERSGLFATSILGSTNGVPNRLIDPKTGAPFPIVTQNGQSFYQIPNCGSTTYAGSCISTQASNVLANGYYPKCNLAGCDNAIAEPNQPNYQRAVTQGTNVAALNTRYIRNFGQDAGNPFAQFSRRSSGPPKLRMNLSATFAYSHNASDAPNVFLPLGGSSETDGYNFSLGYTVSYGRFSNSTTVTWNRSHTLNTNYFTDGSLNPTDQVGITGVPSDHAIGFRPNFYNGLPNISISQFNGLSESAPSDQIGQTISFSDGVSWRRHKHSLRAGIDLRRVHQDSLGGSTALGQLAFTGVNTADPVTHSNGDAFADFLIGLPQSSKIEAGLNKIYLREWVVSGYAQDDWHATDNLTMTVGARYEYFGPYSEKNNRLMNLTGVTSYTTNVGCVTPTGLSFQTSNGAQVNCAQGPTSALIHAERVMLSPRYGVAWSPKTKWTKETVFRAGYGINFNTSQFSSFAKNLSYQQPFAAVQNNVLATSVNPTGCTNSNLTFASPYGCSNKALQNSFGVDPNYRLGMVQVYNADIQKTLPWGLVANLGYNGSHGSNLDVTRAPNQNFVFDPSTNQYQAAVTTQNAVAFRYEDSTGESTFNAFTANLQKRLQHGIGGGVLYQYAHSIDDASSIGGGSSSGTIQNDADIHAERSNSSFDVRHKLSVNWVYEPPFGPNRAFLNKGGVMARIADGWIFSGSATFTSGAYFTPQFSGTAAQTAAGSTVTLRPDRDYAVSTKGSGMATRPQAPTATYFNTNAFLCPSTTTPGLATQGNSKGCAITHYGNASRYSIEGPGTVSVNAALSRSFSLGDTRNLEARITASNVFNTVQYKNISTTANSLSFGEVTSAASMRALTFTARYRF